MLDQNDTFWTKVEYIYNAENQECLASENTLSALWNIKAAALLCGDVFFFFSYDR